MNEDDCSDDELMWPPVAEADVDLILAIAYLAADPSLFRLHHTAWSKLTVPGSCEGGLSLVEELRQKSGRICDPFIDQAIELIAEDIASPGLSEGISNVLIDAPMPVDDGTDEQQRVIRLCELFQGCAWELVAMFACELVSLSKNIPDAPPSSCVDPVSRKRFLVHQLVAYYPA